MATESNQYLVIISGLFIGLLLIPFRGLKRESLCELPDI